MDTFCEQIVQRNPSQKESLLKVVFLTLVIFSGMLLFIFLSVINYLFALVASAAVVFLGFYLIMKGDCEYEYSVTNGELDIDKIIAQRKRKKILTVDVRNFTTFAKYDSKSRNKDLRIMDLSDGIEENKYAAGFNSKNYGRVLLIFSPNEKVLETIKPFFSRNIKA